VVKEKKERKDKKGKKEKESKKGMPDGRLFTQSSYTCELARQFPASFVSVHK